MTRSGSRSVSSTLGSGSSSAFKRASVRGFGSFLGASSLELARSSSPTTSFSSSGDVSSHFFISTISMLIVLPHNRIPTSLDPFIKYRRLVSPTTSRIPLSESSKRTTSRAKGMSRSRMRSWLYLVPLGRRKGSFTESTIGSRQESGPRTRIGCRFSLSSRKERCECLGSMEPGRSRGKDRLELVGETGR